MSAVTVETIRRLKNERKIVVLTAYDALFAALLSPSADMLLVGDSLNMSFGAKPDTLSITIDEMIYHTKAVCRGAREAFVITDMPFGSVMTKEQALKNAARVYKESGAGAVKIEGGAKKAEIVRHLSENSIAVMGHIGLMPQFARSAGGFKVQGKDEQSVQRLIDDAAMIEQAGAFSLVLEGVKADVTESIVKAVKIPVIGIGAGAKADGQVLVWSDMLGFFEAFKPKFARRYMNGAELTRECAKRFRDDVINGAFPNENEQY
ncbi:MAG: 3-methyl-2-oxobutanoate hydroxymethyltransferase [Helicobacteraceae bacterium]|nr:3-methyl-2-oxobutanoate hydroxymethyltransferase [Helicobacteraceae bacterium]